MKIVIEIEESSKDGAPRFRPHVTVGEVDTYLATYYEQHDAIRDSLSYLKQELERGNYSKFSETAMAAHAAAGVI